MSEEQGQEKLSVPFAAKETAVQEFKVKENEKKPDTYKNPKDDIVGEEALDTETDIITADIAKAAAVLAKPYADKLTAKLNTLVAGEKAKLNQKLATINKDSAEKLVLLAADAVVKLATFRTIPEVAQIYELVEKKDKIADISEMKLSTYASDSGYHQVIDKKFDALGLNEEKRQEIQKILGVKVDGKVGPETINELRAMLQIGAQKVEFGKKTLSADGETEFDEKGDVIAPPKTDAPARPVAGDEPKPGEPEGEEKPPEQPKGKSTEMVFSEVSKGFDDINGNELYQFFDFSLTGTNNVITIDHKFYDGATKVCEVTVDEIAGTIKFADGTDIPQDNPFAAIKQRMDAYILPSQLHLVAGEKRNELTVKLPGEMRLQKYSLSKMTQKAIKYDVNEADGNFVLYFQEKSDPPANVGKVIISKTGATVEQDTAAKILLNVDGGQIAVSDKPEERKPEEPKPVDTPPKVEPVASDETKPAPAEPPTAETKPEAPEVAEKPKKTPEQVNGEIRAGLDALLASSEMHRLIGIDLKIQNNVIELSSADKVIGTSAEICQVKVDAETGKIAFKDGTEIPQDNIFAAVNARINSFVSASQVYWKPGSERSELICKFRGKMSLDKYSFVDNTNNNFVKEFGWQDGKIVIDFKDAENKSVGKVILSNAGNSAVAGEKSGVLFYVENGQITLNANTEEPKVAEPAKPEEPVPAEPADEDPKVGGEAEDLKADLGKLRSELADKSTEFTGEKLKDKIVEMLTTKDTPTAISTVLKTKIDQSGYGATMNAMIAKVGNNLDIADGSEDALAIESLMSEAESGLSKLDVASYMETAEVKVLTDRLIEPMKKLNELFAKKIDAPRYTDGGRVKPLIKTGAAKAALIIAVLEFINDDNATLDFGTLEQSIIAAMAEDTNLSEDQQKVFNAAARVPKWHIKSNKIDGPVQYSSESADRNPQNGDYKLVPDSGKAGGDTYGLWIYKAGQDKEAWTYSEDWEFVANYSKTVFEDKVAKYENVDATNVALKEAVATAHQTLIAAKTSNLYEDFKIDSDGLTLTDSKHSLDSPNKVCEFNFGEETGKITFKGTEVKAGDVAGKMREAGDAYIRSLEYPSATVRQGEDANNLKIKFKGEMNEQKYQLDDANYFGNRMIKKVGGNFVVTYKTTENISGGELGRIRQVTLATFTIDKNGSVSVNLNPKFAKTVEATAVSGANAKITLKKKEKEEKTEGCVSDSECPGNQICVDGKCIEPPPEYRT